MEKGYSLGFMWLSRARSCMGSKRITVRNVMGGRTWTFVEIVPPPIRAHKGKHLVPAL